eukprot:4258141-Pyramimonas_sp.AAC.1
MHSLLGRVDAWWLYSHWRRLLCLILVVELLSGVVLFAESVSFGAGRLRVAVVLQLARVLL